MEDNKYYTPGEIFNEDSLKRFKENKLSSNWSEVIRIMKLNKCYST
jgi:hypothetical protein